MTSTSPLIPNVGRVLSTILVWALDFFRMATNCNTHRHNHNHSHKSPPLEILVKLFGHRSGAEVTLISTKIAAKIHSIPMTDMLTTAGVCGTLSVKQSLSGGDISASRCSVPVMTSQHHREQFTNRQGCSGIVSRRGVLTAGIWCSRTSEEYVGR